jgi:hypothetical protein
MALSKIMYYLSSGKMIFRKIATIVATATPEPSKSIFTRG